MSRNLKWILVNSIIVFMIITQLSAFSKKGTVEKDFSNLYSAQESFGFDLFRNISTESPNENVFISPVSLAYALAVILNGAQGGTYQEIQQLLFADDYPISEINQFYADQFEQLLSADEQIELLIANSVWYHNNIELKKAFTESISKYYQAELSKLDFSDPKSAQLINNWVTEKTSGKIDRIVADRLDPMMVMYVINAIYFNGSWSDEFNKKRTHPDKFMLSGNSSIMADMMNRESDLEYFENDLFQAVNLPYGNGAFMMTVLLPQSNKNLVDLIENLTIENWETWKGGFSMLDGVLSLPKFKLAYEIELKEILKSLGMNAPFQSNLADFSQIAASSEIFVDEIKQKTYVDVNEQGTEAAAVTSVGMKTVSIPKPGFIMKVNRPFLIMIRDQKTILFIGKIISPE